MSETEPKTKPRARRGEITTVVGVIEAHDAGRTHVDLSRDLRDALARAGEIARDEGSATTKVTIDLEIATASNGRTEVKLKGKVVAARPSHPTTVLHAMEGGTLSESDPKQMDMPFRNPRKAQGPDEGEGNN